MSRQLERTKLGKLAPKDIILKYLGEALTKVSIKKSVLVDGGKMPTEARLIYKIFTQQKRKILVIYLTLSHQEIYRRLSWRYYCGRTGKPMTVKTRTKKCPHCGGPLIKRADDDPKAIKNRIDYYDKVYSKTVKFWQGKRLLKKINGKQSVEAVTKNIVRVIRQYYGAS